MNKQQKYINFIVDDLVRNTVIDYEEEIISYPFLTPYFEFDFPFTNPIGNTEKPVFFIRVLRKYLVERYGIKDEESLGIVFIYKKRILNDLD